MASRGSDYHKQKLAQLVEYVIQAQENEKKYMKRVKELSQQLLTEKIRLEKTALEQADNHEMISGLREQVEHKKELLLEREQIDTSTILELQHDLNDLKQLEEDQRRALREAEEPIKQREEGEINMLKREIGQLTTNRDHMEEMNKMMENKILQLEEKLKQDQDAKAVAETDCKNGAKEPKRLKGVNGTFEIAKEGLEKQLTEAVSENQEKTEQMSILQKQADTLHEERDEINKKLDSMTAKFVTRSTMKADEEAHLLRKEEERLSKQEARKVLDMELKAAARELRELLQRQTQEKRIFEAEKKDYRRRVALKDQEVAAIAPEESKLESVRHEKSRTEEEIKHQRQLIAEMQAEVELFIGAYLKLETVDKAKRSEVELLRSCESDLQTQITTLNQEEMRQLAELKSLELAREQTTRLLSQKHRQAREAIEETRLKKLEEADLTRRVQELRTREKEFRALYDAVKAERNKYVGMIHRAEQRLAEMRERQRVLVSEAEILKVETRGKDDEYQAAKAEAQKRKEERDKARAEANKQSLIASKLNGEVEQAVLSIDRLNNIINTVEKGMLKLKREYEQAVEQRNFSGIRLIDRNDELCVLWERSNAQERLLKENSDRLLARDEEHRRLNIAVEEMQRQLFAVQKRLPEVPSLAKEVVELREKLQLEEGKASELASKLDDRSELRIRTQEPRENDASMDPKKIRAKLEELEARLSERKEVLLEKDLILEELVAFSEKLRSQAAEGRDESITINQQVNRFQARVADLTKKYQATVAELSMLQADSLRLRAQRENLQQQVDTARDLAYQGLPPTPQAEEEFQGILRREAQREESLAMSRLRAAEEELEASAVVRTRAEPRVSLYVPEDDPVGNFKAYGAHAPLMPSMLGSTMRHIRKPNPKPIEI